jgi:hypothetical protein
LLKNWACNKDLTNLGLDKSPRAWYNVYRKKREGNKTMKNTYRIYVADLDILTFHEVEHTVLWETLSDDAEMIDVVMSAEDYERFDNYFEED